MQDPAQVAAAVAAALGVREQPGLATEQVLAQVLARQQVLLVLDNCEHVIGAALDLGQDRRGVDMGPSAIRYAGLSARLRELGLEVEDVGNVGTAVAEAIDPGDPKERFLPEIKATCEHVAELVERTVRNGSFPLVLGGDHSVALGTARIPCYAVILVSRVRALTSQAERFRRFNRVDSTRIFGPLLAAVLS